MSAIDETLSKIRARPPRWVDQDALPTLCLDDGTPLSPKARAGLIADLKSEGPEEYAVNARTALQQIAATQQAALIKTLLGDWAAAGQPARDRRWLIFASALLGDDALIDALGRRVGEEIAARRHQAAGYCIEALLRAGTPTAQRWLARWSRQAPGLNLRAQAWSARQVLDKAVRWVSAVAPHDHGFSEQGERDYDHGGRLLRLRLAEDGEIAIFDGQRRLRALPTARKQDDAAVVRRSRDDFKALKAAVSDSLLALNAALEEAMILGRPLADWPLLRQAPLAWRASRGLVFSARAGDVVVRFFLSDEGDPLDMQGDDVDIPDGAEIRVVHPMVLTDEARAGWRAILAEARAVPPFEQLSRPLHPPAPGPAPLAAVLRGLPPMATPRLIRGLAARGYLPDTFESYGMIGQSMCFLGPYVITVTHDAYPSNPFKQRTRQPLRLRSAEIRRGKRKVPSESLPAPIFSEIVGALLTL